MLAMNQSAMAQMETDHLLAALEAEGHITPAEKELARRLRELEEEHEAALEQVRAMAPLFEKLQEIADSVLQNDLL